MSYSHCGFVVLHISNVTPCYASDIPTGYVDIFLSCFAVTAVIKYICCWLHDWM